LPFVRCPEWDDRDAAFIERFLVFFLEKFVCADCRFCNAFSTMAKMRRRRAFDTPRREARVVADSAGAEMVRAFDIAFLNLKGKNQNCKLTASSFLSLDAVAGIARRNIGVPHFCSKRAV